jgi:hypothetical protein
MLALQGPRIWAKITEASIRCRLLCHRTHPIAAPIPSFLDEPPHSLDLNTDTMRYAITLFAVTAAAFRAQDCRDAYDACKAAGTPDITCACQQTACLGEDNERNRVYCSSAIAALPSSTSAASAEPTYACRYVHLLVLPPRPGGEPTNVEDSPGHQYPNGEQCVSISGTLALVTATSAPPAEQTYACRYVIFSQSPALGNPLTSTTALHTSTPMVSNACPSLAPSLWSPQPPPPSTPTPRPSPLRRLLPARPQPGRMLHRSRSLRPLPAPLRPGQTFHPFLSTLSLPSLRATALEVGTGRLFITLVPLPSQWPPALLCLSASALCSSRQHCCALDRNTPRHADVNREVFKYPESTDQSRRQVWDMILALVSLYLFIVIDCIF